jgi:hypothetical protein
MLKVMHGFLHPLHDGMLLYLGKQNQEYMALAWRLKMGEHFEQFKHRLAVAKIDYPSASLPDPERFLGSIGAVDCGYSIRPKVHSTVATANGENPSDDRTYSEYIGANAYKFAIVHSHNLLNNVGGRIFPKLLLKVVVVSGGVSDANAYERILADIMSEIHDDVCLLGDQAFISQDRVITPYTIHNHNAYPHLQAQFSSFNSSHSPERMTSEHGVNHMKD